VNAGGRFAGFDAVLRGTVTASDRQGLAVIVPQGLQATHKIRLHFAFAGL